MSEPIIELTIRGSDTVVAHACGKCRRVVNDERMARQCCEPRLCECGATCRRGWTACDDCLDRKALTGVSPATARQPDPVVSRHPPHPAVWDLVIDDITSRDNLGEEKYGTRLRPYSRDALADLYQELPDAVVYLRQVPYERDSALTKKDGR